MHDFAYLGLAFILGWAACVAFIAWIELTSDREPADDAPGDCWPFRHDELAARPDWIAKFEAAARDSAGDGAGGSNVVRLHHQISSRLLSSGSEGSL